MMSKKRFFKLYGLFSRIVVFINYLVFLWKCNNKNDNVLNKSADLRSRRIAFRGRAGANQQASGDEDPNKKMPRKIPFPDNLTSHLAGFLLAVKYAMFRKELNCHIIHRRIMQTCSYISIISLQGIL